MYSQSIEGFKTLGKRLELVLEKHRTGHTLDKRDKRQLLEARRFFSEVLHCINESYQFFGKDGLLAWHDIDGQRSFQAYMVFGGYFCTSYYIEEMVPTFVRLLFILNKKLYAEFTKQEKALLGCLYGFFVYMKLHSTIMVY